MEGPWAEVPRPQAARREGGDVAFVFCPTAFEHLPRSLQAVQPSSTISSLVAASAFFLPFRQIEQDAIYTK
jgi:hypothetical protein